MATEVILPKVDMVMETGTFVEWLVQEGAAVRKGEPLFVIQTDKAAIEVEAPESGILASTRARADEVIPVTSVIGYILQPGESLPEAAKETASAPQQVAAAEKAPEPALQGLRATPLARSLAQELRLDLAQVPGSGPRGRIYRADVERFLAAAPPPVNADPLTVDQRVPEVEELPQAIPQPLPGTRERRREPLKGARAITAQRLAHSAQTIPHIHISLDVDMREAARLRKKVNPVAAQGQGRGISYTAILAYAVARILEQHPTLNSSLQGEEIVYWADIDLGIATDLGNGLVVPVVRAAQKKSLTQIADEIAALAEKARARKLLPAEMSGSTFTISNLGMKGAVSFTAIINPPETAILAVGKIVETPVAKGRKMVIRPMLNLTLAVDHRVTDGAQAVAFLNDLKAALENPYLLI